LNRRHAKQRKVIGRSNQALHLFRLRIARHGERHIAVGREVSERVLLRLKREEFDGRMIGLTELWYCAPHPNQPLRIFELQRTQQHRIDHTKNRRVHANAQCQRQHSNQRKAWIFPQHPYAKPQVLYECFEHR